MLTSGIADDSAVARSGDRKSDLDLERSLSSVVVILNLPLPASVSKSSSSDSLLRCGEAFLEIDPK